MINPIPSQDELDRINDRHLKSLVIKGKANRLVRYYAGAEAAADAAGIP